MLRFDPSDPYPLPPPAAQSGAAHAWAKEHSAEVDSWLGLRTESVEAEIANQAKRDGAWAGHQAWINLPVQTLLTPYTEIRQMLHLLAPRPGETVVDLGAGYGRMGFVICTHYPGTHFVGYELVEARVKEGRRCLDARGCADSQLLQADLSLADFHPIEAEYYFIYDFGTREAISKTLEDLRQIAKKGKGIAVIGRGRSSRDAIERGHPWLSQVVEPEHHGNFSIYRSY